MQSLRAAQLEKHSSNMHSTQILRSISLGSPSTIITSVFSTRNHTPQKCFSTATAPPPLVDLSKLQGVEYNNVQRKSKVGRLPLIPVEKWEIDTPMPHNAKRVLIKAPSLFFRPLLPIDVSPTHINYMFEISLPAAPVSSLDTLAQEIVEVKDKEREGRYCFFFLAGNYNNCAALTRSIKKIYLDRLLQKKDLVQFLSTTFKVDANTLKSSPAQMEFLQDRHVTLETSALQERFLVALDGAYRPISLSNTDGVLTLSSVLTNIIEKCSESPDSYLPRSLYSAIAPLAIPKSTVPSIAGQLIHPWLSQHTPTAARIKESMVLAYLFPISVLTGAMASATTPPTRIACLQSLQPPNSIASAFNVFSPTRQDYVDAFAARMTEWIVNRIQQFTVSKTRVPNEHLTLRMLDMGCGTGVLSLVAARLFAHETEREAMRLARLHITAVDNNPRAVDSTRKNLMNVPDVVVGKSNLFEQVVRLDDMHEYSPFHRQPHGKYDVIVFNPPWIPLSVRSRASLDSAIFDERHDTLRRFLRDVNKHLSPGGTVFLIVSDLAERLGLDAPDAVKQMIASTPDFAIVSTHVTPSYKTAEANASPLEKVRAEEKMIVFTIRSTAPSSPTSAATQPRVSVFQQMKQPSMAAPLSEDDIPLPESPHHGDKRSWSKNRKVWIK